MLLAPACAMRRRHTSHRLSRRRRGALWTLGGKTCAQDQNELSVACHANETGLLSFSDGYKLNTAYSRVESRAPAAAAHYHRSPPPPDDGTPTHAPRHRSCFTLTVSVLEPLVVRYTIRNTYATASSSCTLGHDTSRRAHHRLPSREAARGFPAVCVRTITDGVEDRSGRL